MRRDLQGLKILITRPAEQAQVLAAQLRALNAVPIIFPTIEIAASPDLIAAQALLEKLPQQDIAIFISPTSVVKSLELIKTNWSSSVKIAAIGAATAAALQQKGLKVDYFPSEDFSSEGLLTLPALQNIRNKNIFLFRGLGGRELLAEKLRERGACLTEVATYQRVKPVVDMVSALSDWQSQKIDVIVCTSNTGLQNLYEMVGVDGRDWLQNVALLATSQRMVELAKSLDFTRVILAKNPSDAAVVEILMNFCSNK